MCRFGSDFFSAERFYGAPFNVTDRRSDEQPIFWEFVQHVLAKKR